MRSDKVRCYIMLAAAVLFAIALSIVRIVLVVNYYDVSEGLYSSSAVGVDIARIFMAVSILGCGAAAFFLTPKKKAYKELPEASHGVVFTGSLCGFMFISSIILEVVYFFGDVKKSSGTGLFVLFLLSLVFCALSSVYYFWCASTSWFRGWNYRILSVMPTLWAACYSVYLYFDKSTVINSPEKLMMQLSMITIMLYTVSEARFHFGIARPRFYSAISVVAIITIIVACVPNFLLTAFWILPFSSDTVFSALQIGFAAYIMQRLLSVMSAKTE